VPGVSDATPDDLERLLVVQAHDTALDRLHRRLADLPERGALVELDRQLAAVQTEIAAVDEQLAEVRGRERRLDDDVQSVAAKADDVERTLYGGTVRSPRELEALQADLGQLRAHQSRLEDRELDVMEERESLEHRRGELAAAGDSVARERAKVAAALAAAERAIGEEVRTGQAARDEQAAAVPAALLADYERRRAANRGVGIAVLVGATCQGCGLTIPAVEVDRFRHAPAGTICTPESCVCILVPK
jgi:predicted  nucleic acid-binding Zn-ribbon protein